MDRVKALKEGSIYIEDKYPIKIKLKQINSQQAEKLSNQLQTPVDVTSEEERGPSEELTKAFGSIVLKDNKSLNNQDRKSAESKKNIIKKPIGCQ